MKITDLKYVFLAAAGACAIAAPAAADVVSLDFEGIATAYPSSNNIRIMDYYNGGAASNGNIGPDYGVSFSNNALLICLNSLDDSCSNTSWGGTSPESAQGALYFLDGKETYLNYTAGFTDGFSFNYVSVRNSGSVHVYDGLNGTGNVLASINLEPNSGSCPGYGADFCPFSPIGVTFEGVAQSIAFGGVANEIVFDDITFGSHIPGPGPDIPAPGIPEPASWALLIAGFGLVGTAIRRRRITAFN